jgi:MscS family membrane protein
LILRIYNLKFYKISYLYAMKYCRYLFFCLILVLPFGVFAQNSANETPYSTVYMHLHYLQSNDYNISKSAKAFDLNSKEAQRSALQLKQILDGKGIVIDLNKIPDNADYVDSVQQKQVYVLSNKLPQIYLEKQGKKWYYSKETTELIPRLHKLVYPFGSAIWVQLLPYKSDSTFLKLYYWQWLGFFSICLAFIVSYYITRFLSYLIIKKIAERKISNPFDDLELLRVIANSFSLVIAFLVMRLFLPTLLLSTKLSASITKAVHFISAVVLIWYIYNLVEFIMRYASQLAKRTPSKLDDQLLQVLRRFAKAGILIFGVFYLLSILDVNITTVIAGISIGGLAFALAAQDTVKNFIGSLMIFADKPFRIGDTISGTDFEGEVLEVGFRSTRIKTPANSIVTVANGKLADMTIDNKGFVHFKLYKTEIVLPYETPLYKVERFIDGIRSIILKYPAVKNSTVNVFLSTIHSGGMVILINFGYKFTNLKEELQNREIILMQIIRLADLMQLRLFEQQQQVVVENKTAEVSIEMDDIDHEIERFFVEYDTKLAAQQKKK